jgi:hypothetical protein
VFVVVTRLSRQSLYGGCSRPNSAIFEADSPRAGTIMGERVRVEHFRVAALGVHRLQSSRMQKTAGGNREHREAKLGGTSKRLVGTHCSTEYRHGVL